MIREVHVWCAALDPPVPAVARLAATLSPDERERARRFAFEHLRRRFVVARGVLRELLGRYLEAAPASLRFEYGTRGKPALAGRPLQFNVSHSHELVLVAVTGGREVGVDVERVRPVDDLEGLASRFFAPGESERLLGLPAEQQEEAFFACWTRKEAYLKAVGDGLAMPLDEFHVTLAPGEPARLLSIRGDRRAAERWLLSDLDPADGYVGAVAVEDRSLVVSVRTWEAAP